MDKEYLKTICQANGYTHLKFFDDGHEAAIMPLMFTHAIVYGLNHFGYEDRWCYSTYEKAKAALEAWEGTGEPDGWHRHPKSGRRRHNGVETINF